MKRNTCAHTMSVVSAALFLAATGQAEDGASGSLAASPGSIAFSYVRGGATPASQVVTVSASASTRFSASVSTTNGGNWLAISPSGSLTTTRKITVSVTPGSLSAGVYRGSITAAGSNSKVSVAVTLTVASQATSSSGGGFKLIGWNDLGMHCIDGQDYSIFAVLPPYNTIHAHLLDASGRLVNTDIGYSVTYQSITDPLTNTINTTSTAKTNFWQYAPALGFGSLAADTGLAGFRMPGASNTPQALKFKTADNTWTAEGIPILPYADSTSKTYPTNYFPMMRLVAKNTLGNVLASTDIVLPVSDELNCGVCHSSSSGNAAAKPRNGWVNNADPAKDLKLNILRKHDDQFGPTALFQTAATQAGYNPSGLEATVAKTPILCARCHGSNALGLAGVSGVKPLTTAMHSGHALATDPSTNQMLDASNNRTSCYLCHPGPKTQCLRGAMGALKNSSGSHVIECQSCHGTMSNVATATRNGWLDEPNCQSCHTGTAVKNSGQIVYTSVFSSGNIVRAAADQTFATNANTPAAGVSLYRFSKGHGNLQCESCHGSTHAEFPTTVLNDNVQSTNLQGHAGTIAECTACHSAMPSTVTGGPHGLHPIGPTWVNSHPDVAERQGTTGCQLCHGVDYRGTVLSKVQADRTMAGRSFPRGTVVGCYNCHNGPRGD